MKHNSDKVNLGCGIFVIQGWINIDFSLNAWLARHKIIKLILKLSHLAPGKLFLSSWDRSILIHDVRKGLPFKDNSKSAVYSSFLWEHLYLEQGKRLLRECFRVLKPGGVLRVVVPDLGFFISQYVNAKKTENSSAGSDIELKADKFILALCMHDALPVSGSALYRFYTSITELHLHKWWYDAESLLMYFKQAGFVDAQSMSHSESKIAELAEFESKNQDAGVIY